MKTTRVGTLVALAVIAIAVGWSGARVVASMTGSMPDVPGAAPFAMVFLSAVLIGGALLMRRRVHHRRENTPRVSPELAVRLLVLAKASALVGAVVLGAYAGLGIYHAEALSVPARRSAAIVCVVTTVAALITVVGALWLERECRAPDDEDDDQDRRNSAGGGGLRA